MVHLLQLDQEVVGISGTFPLQRHSTTIMADNQRCLHGQPGVKPYLARSHRLSQSSFQPFQSVERKLSVIYNWEKRHSMSDWILKKQALLIRNEIKRQQKSYIRSVSEQAVISYDAGRYFILKFSICCRFKHDKAGIFLKVLFYLDMVDKMWQGVIDSLDVEGCDYLLQV